MSCRRYRGVKMTDFDGDLDQLPESELEDGASGLGTPSGSEEESDDPFATLPPSSLKFRTPDPSQVAAKKVKKAFTDPGKMTKLGSRRGARCLSESSDEQQSPTLEQTKKAPSHKRAKQQKDDGAGCSLSTKGLYVGGTPNTSVHTGKSKSLSCHTEPSTSESTSSDGASLISAQLGEITNLLHTLDKRVANTEKELKSIKTKLRSASSSESSSKETVPLIVKSETRRTYKTLIDEEGDFEGFIIGPGVTFSTPANKKVVSTLMKEVKGANPTFDACHIRTAAYTYYKTLSQQESLERRGKADERNQLRRRRERLSRKLQERVAAFKKCGYKEVDYKKWSKVLINDCMSSEESGDDDTLVVRPLSWRSDLVNTFFANLDKQNMEEKSPQARRQLKGRLSGAPSSRPAYEPLPQWALKPTL